MIQIVLNLLQGRCSKLSSLKGLTFSNSNGILAHFKYVNRAWVSGDPRNPKTLTFWCSLAKTVWNFLSRNVYAVPTIVAIGIAGRARIWRQNISKNHKNYKGLWNKCSKKSRPSLFIKSKGSRNLLSKFFAITIAGKYFYEKPRKSKIVV